MKAIKRSAVLLVAIAMVLLAACGGNGGGGSKEPNGNGNGNGTAQPEASNAKPVELVFAMQANANEIPGWTAMIDAANKKLKSEGKNITIKIEKINTANWPEYYQKVNAQIAGGRSPDLGRIAESFMPQIIKKDQALDITDMVDSLDKSQYFEASFQNSGYQDGKYYGLPSGIFYMLMYYNKDMFDAKGIAHPSKDWNQASSFAEIREMAKQFTAGEGASKTFGLSAGPFLSYAGGMFSLSNGGKNVFNDDLTPAITEPETKEVYQWFDDMLRIDHSLPRPTDTKIMGGFDMFKAGRIGMAIDGTWYVGSVKNDIKNFKVGIAAIPSGKGKAYSSQFIDNFLIWKGTKHPEEAKEALKAIYSKEAWDALAKLGVGGLPIHRGTFDEIKGNLFGDAIDADDLAAFTQALDHTVSVPYNAFYEEADQKINAQLDGWLLGKFTVDEFLDKAAQILLETKEKTGS
ncbi:sugar ABC transporter substrate-binding protein [Paenibacillus sp. 598K]|uniref:ABC transporter substrate-binding protein n=1 Tax=Paenibacillus sp. 598K TaxID=1117987 RepID=UPI000FF9E944|nr:sugar ABC transporter substrate-binding protein [Paenibacillus sp. 598K]GBF76378.1 sugar ABC transporter substrate-binding protein [Paenibacillus sp. 598K]